MTESIDPLKTVQPLTHLHEDGTIYTRRPHIEASIEAQLGLSYKELIRRANLGDREAAEFLPDEVLVYFIRAYQTSNDQRMVLRLATILLERHAQHLVRQFRKLGLDKKKAEWACHDVFRDVILAVTQLDANAGDYFQVNFGDALRHKYLTSKRRELSDLKSAQSHVSLSGQVRTLLEPSDEMADGILARDVDMLQSCDAADNTVLVAERTKVVASALKAIKDHRHRQAFVLRHYEGWAITTKDPSEPCLSRYFDCDPKTIHNWLKTAEADLTIWRETQQ